MSDIEDWLKFLESPEGYFVERMIRVLFVT